MTILEIQSGAWKQKDNLQHLHEKKLVYPLRQLHRFLETASDSFDIITHLTTAY